MIVYRIAVFNTTEYDIKEAVTELLPKFPVVTRSDTLADKVFVYLEEAIIEGEIPAGTRLIETELAEKFGVSRPPVREAIQRLGANGLVRIVPHKCAVVALPDIEEVEEIYAAKKLIEGFSAREAAGRLSSKEIIQLKSLIHKMETHIKRQEGDKYTRVAEQFHDLVNCAARNKVTYGIYQKLSKQTLWHRINFLSFPRRLKRSLSEHKKILDALIQGNQDLAESLMKEHIEYSKKILLERLRENAKDGSKERGEI